MISLEQLMKDLKREFIVDETLKAYLYENKIEFVDYTSPIDLENGDKLEDFYGNLCTIYIDKENKISTIENSCINLITPVNVKVINFLTSLIGEEIEAYDQYPKLPSIRELDCKEL